MHSGVRILTHAKAQTDAWTYYRISVYYLQELDDDVITAAELNNAAVVSKWLKDLPKGDVTIRDKLVQILKRAAQHLSVDVIRLFKPPSK